MADSKDKDNIQTALHRIWSACRALGYLVFDFGLRPAHRETRGAPRSRSRVAFE